MQRVIKNRLSYLRLKVNYIFQVKGLSYMQCTWLTLNLPCWSCSASASVAVSVVPLDDPGQPTPVHGSPTLACLLLRSYYENKNDISQFMSIMLSIISEDETDQSDLHINL